MPWLAVAAVVVSGAVTAAVVTPDPPTVPETAAPPVPEPARPPPRITYVEEGTVPSRLDRWRGCTRVDEVAPRTGCVRWRQTVGIPQVLGPVAHDGTVYVHGVDALAAVSIATGRPRWTTLLGGAPTGPAAVDRSTAYVGLDTGEVVAVGEDSGRIQWQRDVVDGIVRVAAADGRVAVAAAGRVAVVDGGDGDERWHVAAVRPAPPVFAGDAVVVADQGRGTVTAYGAADGSPRWRWTAGSGGLAPDLQVAVGDAGVAVATADAVILLDPTDGGVRWTAEPAGQLAPVLVTGSTVLVGARAYDARDGRSAWRITRDLVVSATALDGTVLYATIGGTLHAVDEVTGEERWSTVAGQGTAVASAAPSTLVVTTADTVSGLALPATLDRDGALTDATWAELRRAIQLPTYATGECPTSPTTETPLGSGHAGRHVVLVGLDGDGAVRLVPVDADTPMLVRGMRIDGRSALLFPRPGVDTSADSLRPRPRRHDPAAELRLDADGVRTGRAAHWDVPLAVPGPGCWVVQVDGLDFRDTVVFEAASR